ncbi:hypothetical protein AB1E18_010214 [Capra hircus]
MLEYLAGRFQLRSTRGREETACAGSIRGFAALGPSPSLNCIAGTVQHLLTSSSLDLQPTFLAPRYLSVICSVPGRCLVLSSCGTVAQQERTAQTHPSEVAWPITSWRIRERLLLASQPRERWRGSSTVHRGPCEVSRPVKRQLAQTSPLCAEASWKLSCQEHSRPHCP